MSKMVDKDELRFLRKMASEGNLESKLMKGAEKIVDQGDLPLIPSAAEKNLVRHGSKELADSMENKMKQSVLSKLASRGLGRAASIAAGPLALLPEIADAAELGRGSDIPPSKEQMLEAAKEMNKESYLEELRNRGDARAEKAMANQDMERDIAEKIQMDEKIDSIINAGKSDEDLEQEAARRLHQRLIKEGRIPR